MKPKTVHMHAELSAVEILVNASLKPAKLVENFMSIHPKNTLDFHS